MTTRTQATSVTTQIDVEAPVEHAFQVFTAGIGSWWDPGHHILDAELAEMVFEPYVGGHIIDRGVDGSECRWARVLAYEPPHRVVFSWDIDLRWEIATDPAKVSEVEVTFTADGPGRTHVVLTHRNLDRHGEGWESMRDAVGSGWSLVHFAETAARRPLETDLEHVAGVRLPVITDEMMRERLPGASLYTAVLLRTTEKFIRPDVDPIIWEHGRRNFALREHGVLAIVLPVSDDSDLAGLGVFAATPDEVRAIMDHDPGVKAGIFTYEVHPVRGFPGSVLP